MAEVKIACPKCNWEPQPSDLWQCSCGHQWNTFDTGGRCPSCKKQWKQTRCLIFTSNGCGQWSPHLDWYRNLDEWLIEQLRKIEKPVEVPVEASV